MLRDAGPVHETAPTLLSELLTRLGQERGSRIRCAGAVYLMERDGDGRPRQVLVADQTIYLDRSVWRPRDPAIVLGVDPLPDVILEVDHTTDVRRNKLPVYAAWGFPEVWVDTPDEPSPNRPRRLRPGLTIYLLEEGRYRIADESRAFPTWTAAQLHAALNEGRLGPRTLADLTRVADGSASARARPPTTTRSSAATAGRPTTPGSGRGWRRAAPRAPPANEPSSFVWRRGSSARPPPNESPRSSPSSKTPTASPKSATCSSSATTPTPCSPACRESEAHELRLPCGRHRGGRDSRGSPPPCARIWLLQPSSS